MSGLIWVQTANAISRQLKLQVVAKDEPGAVKCDFKQCGILTSVDSDEPVQSTFKLRTPNGVQSVARQS